MDYTDKNWCCVCTNWTYTELKLNAFLSFFHYKHNFAKIATVGWKLSDSYQIVRVAR